MNASLTKNEIISNNSVINALIHNCAPIKGGCMRVRFRSREQRNFRIIVLVARGEKKMTCCDKNRIKRIGKEIFRTQKHTLAIPYGDIVLSLTKSVCNIPHYERIAMFIALTRKAATLGGAPHKRMITSQGKN